jgi:hypothetical protein
MSLIGDASWDIKFSAHASSMDDNREAKWKSIETMMSLYILLWQQERQWKYKGDVAFGHFYELIVGSSRVQKRKYKVVKNKNKNKPPFSQS